MSLMQEYNETRLKAAGEKAPSFVLHDQKGHKVTLNQLISDGYAILYFYSHDGAPGLEEELLELNEYQEKFQKMGGRVAAISQDTVETHKSYADKQNLSLTLLADPDQEVADQYGVKSTSGINVRATFVVDQHQEIVRIFSSRRSRSHIEDIYMNLSRPSVN